MSTATKMIGLLAIALVTMFISIGPSWAEDEQPVLVGRVYDIDGDLLRYVPDDNDWVAVVKDAPVGAGDTFFSGNKGMAELISPNGSWVRIGDNTQIQFLTLNADLSETDVAMGMARFYNKGTDTIIKATSPFGYVMADPGTVFDFYVGENSVEVVAIKGTVSFVQSSTEARYDVNEGSPSIIADQDSVSSGEGTVDPDWDDWNSSRDSYWSAKMKVKGPSAGYLPPSLVYDSDVLDENGEWVFLPYEGRDCWFWSPTRVAIGWSPFTIGVWSDWYGDETWIPAEPFGYVTHHYGNWVYIRNRWCWAPPVVGVRVGLSLLDVSFWWCPGRVSWIHRGVYVGWVPLAPGETYYSHRHWGGRHAREIRDENVTQVNINIRNYTYVDHAIIVKQDRFHGVDNYRDNREHINRNVVKNFKAAPVINNTVINNYAVNKERHNFTNVTVNEKPHSAVVNRIKHNESIMRQERNEKASDLQQQVRNAREGKINRNVQIEAPKSTNYIVPSNEANRPKSEIKFQQKEIKFRGRTTQGENKAEQPSAQQPNRTITPSQPGQMQKPAVQPDRMIMPSNPSQREKNEAQPGTATPSKEIQKEKPDVKPGRTIAPSMPGKQETPVMQQPGRVTAPSVPGKQETPAVQQQPGRSITPTTPGQQERQEKPAVQPGRVVVPATPARQETPSIQQQPGRSLTPSTQGQTEKPAAQPGRISVPSKPVQPETPAVQQNRAVAPAAPSQPRMPEVKPNRGTTPSQPNQPQAPVTQPNRVNTPSAPVERGVEKSNRTEKPESSSRKVDSQEKVRKGKTKESTENEDDKEIQR
jgi:hypothetical protein